MLELKKITKDYPAGGETVHALKGIDLQFRKSEFVSILGQSGCGKTTMLNIIGGLDQYTSGDLIINGKSTKNFKDRDWDAYRNHSIGFVFQSYNLIPHQTVLQNVELALTLSGVSKSERRARAKKALEEVGLASQLHKKPSEMSGGQMQRVAIARALVNNPDILLADEPTGALDSETSIQIMELLREIAKDKLVIMVTHNPELAKQYSTRIIQLLDGRIVSDTEPFTESEKESVPVKQKKISMSFFTALSLSFNNLRTKKGRTLLTSFAGSIGIIGIALILALSTGMNEYINDIQKATMTAYPITINAESIDFSSAMGMRGEIVGTAKGENEEYGERTGVYADYKDIEANAMISSNFVKNNLTKFKKYLDDMGNAIHQYLGENGIIYTYDVNFQVYSYDSDGHFINSDIEITESSPVTMQNGQSNILSNLKTTLLGNKDSSAGNFSELMPGTGNNIVSNVVTSSYELLYGNWPQSYNEVILILDENNSISTSTLYQLGFITKKQYDDITQQIKKGGSADTLCFDYDEILKHPFYLVTACDHYVANEDGTFTYVTDDVLNEELLLANAIELKISGIVRPRSDTNANTANISTSSATVVAYTSMLTDYIITHTDSSAVVKAQEADKEINVITGMKFESPDNISKAEDAKKYLSSLNISEKASFYKLMMFYASGSNENAAATGGMLTDENSMAVALDMWLNNNPGEEILLKVYDEYIAGSTYEENMSAFGKVSYDAPSSISIYADSFEDKDAITECIRKYNETAGSDNNITYTDYVAMLTSSITTIINGISYVLMAFVAISLIVSCIMIGIITHISVMERTKEIGILRALGASKQNISQVFNAETFIIGCCAGIIGIAVSLAALLPINNIIQRLSGITELTAKLPFKYSALLIILSILITITGGLLPAQKAAKKDPVIALRTE